MTQSLRWSRRWFHGLIAIAAFGLMGFSFDTESSTGGLLAEARTVVTDDFFRLLRAGNVAGAQARLAAGPRKSETADTFAAAMKGLGLTSVQSTVWTKRTAKTSGAASTGELEGWATLLDGKKIQVLSKLSAAAGVWTIVDVGLGKATPPAAAPASSPLAAPVSEELNRLVQATTATFIEGFREQSMAVLHRSVHTKMQTQVPLDAFNKAFKPETATVTGNLFSKRRPTITTPAAIDANGELKVEATYAFDKSHMVYKLGYLPENGEWKLFSIDYRSVAGQPATTAAPAKGAGPVTTPVKPVAPAPLQK